MAKNKNKNKEKESAPDFGDTARTVGEKVGKTSKKFWTEFKKFVAKGNVVDLAVAVVVGAAFNKIVTSLVSCIITPLTSLLLRVEDISGLKLVLVPGVEADEAAGIAAVPEIALLYGQFIQSVIDFLIVALTIFVVLRVFVKLKSSFNRKEREAEELKKKAEDEKKKAEAEAEAQRQALVKQEFLDDVSVQADVLNDIKAILLRMESGKQT